MNSKEQRNREEVALIPKRENRTRPSTIYKKRRYRRIDIELPEESQATRIKDYAKIGIAVSSIFTLFFGLSCTVEYLYSHDFSNCASYIIPGCLSLPGAIISAGVYVKAKMDIAKENNEKDNFPSCLEEGIKG
jgi:hypothetical protein